MHNFYRVIVFSISLLMGFTGIAQEVWAAPDTANNIENPLDNINQATEKGAKLYQSLCVACHGVSGRGDGVAAAGLSPKPASFYTKEFSEQTEGAVFWKLSKGRGVMAGYETMLSDDDRWALVVYLKSLNSKTTNQEEKLINDDKNIKGTFLFTQLINSQTVQVLPKKSSEFTIQHRFGATELNSSFIDQFLGMDLSSNIRFAYAVALNDRLYTEIGRTKYGKVYDIGFKYLWLRQTTDNKMPFSLALYTDVGIMTDKFPTLIEGSTFDDGSDFEYLFSHRLTYNLQIILAKKFSDKFSLQVNPVFLWRNLVTVDEDNFVMAIPIGGRIRLTHKTALLFEATPVFNTANSRIPISLSYEIASSSAHAFQIVLTSTDRIIESAVYTQPTYDYTEGKFVLGFNIKRLF